MAFLSSLPVENVQALAEAASGSRDEEINLRRYLRGDAGAEDVVAYGVVPLPAVDLARLVHPETSQDESANLGLACREWGFFQLVNHGIPEDVMANMKRDTAEFFNLPLEEKKAYAQQPGNISGYGQAFVVSNDQTLDWSDAFFLSLRPEEARDMRFWPQTPPTFRKSIDSYSAEVAKTAALLLQFMAKDLGIEPELLQGIFLGQPQAMRMNYYPPCIKSGEVLGLSPHSDGSGFTLLLQVNDVQGLQIRKDGRWLAVEALPDAFVVNIGDMLEIITNGEYKSIEHRATINPVKERLSVALFQNPAKGAVVGPLPEIVKGGQVHYRSVGMEEFVADYFSKKLQGKSHLQNMKLSDE